MTSTGVPEYNHFSTYPNTTSVFNPGFYDGFYHLSNRYVCRRYTVSALHSPYIVIFFLHFMYVPLFTIFVLKATFDANKDDKTLPYILSLSETSKAY